MESSYKTVVDNAKADLTDLLDSKEGWTVVKTYGKEKELMIESKPSETNNCNVYRSTLTLEAPLKVVDETFPLCPFTTHKEWAPDISDVILVESLGDGIIIFQTTTPSIARIISPRSFVTVGGSNRDSTRVVRYAVSIDYQKPLKEDGMVRGINGPYGARFTLDPADPEKTRAELIMQIDFQGKLPRKFVDSSIPTSIVNSYEAYKTYMKKNGLFNTR